MSKKKATNDPRVHRKTHEPPPLLISPVSARFSAGLASFTANVKTASALIGHAIDDEQVERIVARLIAERSTRLASHVWHPAPVADCLEMVRDISIRSPSLFGRGAPAPTPSRAFWGVPL